MGVGSPAYMSPEQIKNYPLNQKTDLYSLGVVFFHMLTGRLPFRAKNPAQLVYKIINTDTPAASQLNPNVPEAVDGVIRKAMEKDLYSRYKNGAEFAKELSGIQFKIFDEKDPVSDNARFSQIRRLHFFTEFEDVEIWEVVRVSAWKLADEMTQLIREGSTDQRFGVLIDGELELSVKGKVVGTILPGDSFGESAYMDSVEHLQSVSVISKTMVRYIEITPSALALASEECVEHFRSRLVTTLVRRLAMAELQAAEHGKPAIKAINQTLSGVELRLVDD
jgi:non-specific serine/threonine protein kinase